MNESTAMAAAVLAALRRGGVTDVVLAPGSRSAALAVALHQADIEGSLRLHVRIDERTAGFLALGLAKGAHRPVAVVTTSGTAVANLHPAVLEALHSGVPLVVLSADRPAWLRGTGANQTTEQVGMFGTGVPCIDVVPAGAEAAAEGVAEAVRRRGPTQLNLQFAEPLLPDGPTQPDDRAASASPHATGGLDAVVLGERPPRRLVADEADVEELPLGPRTVVVAGDDAGPPARLLAERAHWPLLAEPTSGSRTGDHAIRTYRLLLGSDLGKQIERVVVTGHPTLSRPVTQLISRSDVDVISVRGPGGVSTDPARVARRVDSMPRVDEGEDDGWLQRWLMADRSMGRRVDEVAEGPLGLPLRVAAEVAGALAPGELLVVGSSQPIRDLDLMAQPYVVGQRRLVIGNRGLAGIDGTLSTAIGASLGRPSPRALAYVGDLTFLHDANGLVIGRDEPRPDLTVIVANDDGGAIFSTLEQGGARHSASFERVFGTPHGVSLQKWCDATGTAYRRVTDARELRTVLADPQPGIEVVEVPISRVRRRELNATLTALH